MSINDIAKRFLYGALSLAGMLGYSGISIAAGAYEKEIATAADHASYAAKAGELDKVHHHLHHVVNCLIGPSGSGFDTGAGNPCGKEGAGILNDIPADSEIKKPLEQALVLAKTGADIDQYEPAHNVALAVEELLQAAEK